MNPSTKMVWRSLLCLGLALSSAGCVGADGGDLEGDDEPVAESALGHEGEDHGAPFGCFPGGGLGGHAPPFGGGRPSPYGGVQGGLYSHSFPPPSHYPPPSNYPPSSCGGNYPPQGGHFPPYGGQCPWGGGGYRPSGGYLPPRGGYCSSGGGGYQPPPWYPPAGGGGGYYPPAGGGCGK